jgi:small-conductance mechanosensitive channel
MTDAIDQLNALVGADVLGNPVSRWFLALLILAAVLAAVALWRWVILHRFRPLAIRTNTFLDDVAVILAETTAGPLVILLGAYAGSLALSLEPGLQGGLRSVAIVLFLIQAGIWGSALIRRWVERYNERNRETNAAGAGTARLIGTIARLVLYALVLLLILDNVPGVEVTALVASLGIGGIAVALAAQNILGDLFASLSIALDKPFVVGDFISVGSDSGTVEQIGLKTTRVRSISGEQLIFSNGDLLASRIRNFARLQERRNVFTFRVPVTTPPERLRAIPAIVREIVEPIADTRFDRAHLARFDDLGLVFEVVYFVTTPDFMRHVAIQHTVNVELLERLEAEGVGFAFLSDAVAADARARRDERDQP